MNPTLDARLRKTLEAIRDEFRLLYLKHPPLYHNRFTSPIPVTRAGWEAFSKLHFDGMDEVLAYVASGDGYLGIFKTFDLQSKGGTPQRLSIFTHQNYAEFRDMCHRLGSLLIRRPIETWEAISEWMDILHDVAELKASPLLDGSVGVFIQHEPCSDSDSEEETPDTEEETPDADATEEKTIDISKVYDERSFGDAKFPKHPIVGHLGRDVFRASAAAIDLLLDPQSYFVWRQYTADIMPFDLADLIAQNATIVPASQTPTATAVAAPQLPDYLFAKTGNIWKLRFRLEHGNKVEYGEFAHTKGFEYYHKLLQAGRKGITALDLSGRNMVLVNASQSSTAVDEDEQWDESDDGTHEGGNAMWQKLNKSELADLAEQIALLEEAMENATDEQQKEYRKQLRVAKRELKSKVRQNPHARFIFAAINRVKSCLRRMRVVIRAEKMFHLAKFLENHVKNCGDGWQYSHETPIQWVFTVSV